jgi:hypothetical protein
MHSNKQMMGGAFRVLKKFATLISRAREEKFSEIGKGVCGKESTWEQALT